VAISLLIFAHMLVSSLVGLVLWLRLPASLKSQLPATNSQEA
jgi:predicted metal-binding protein